MKMIRLILFLFITIMCFGCSTDSKRRLIFERLNTCSSGDLDSTFLCGTFAVFENRQTNSGRKININIIVVPAIHHNPTKAPIFFFDGGPGIAATNAASYFADSQNYFNEERDIVLIDVRGTGGSNPLHCQELQRKENLEQQFAEMYPVADVKHCYDSLSGMADLTQYTTTNMAQDVEEIRNWLGYKKINLFGLSFGGRLALVYMKLFPASVESCVLWSPTTTSSKMPLYHAQFAESSIHKLFEDCERDSLCNLAFPNIRDEFSALMERGKREPFSCKYKNKKGETRVITIPWYSIHTKLRSLLYTPFGLRQIPFIIHQSYIGNWQPFTDLFPDESAYDDFIAGGLYLCVTCTEDVPYITKQASDSLSIGTFMGDYRIQQQVNACKYWSKGKIPDNFFDPVISDIPTLVLSGYFDPVTPPSMAEQIVQTLPNSFLISIKTMSHTSDGLSHEDCLNKMIVDFLDLPDTRPDSECIGKMLPDEYKLK